MGTSFASLHICAGKRVSEVIAQLKQNNQNLNRQSEILAGSLTSGWVTLLSAEYNWETIEEEGKRLSTIIQEPILSVGYFDDEIFTFYLFMNGQLLTQQICGFGLEGYGLNEKDADVDQMIKTLIPNKSANQLGKILRERDLESLVEQLEHLLGVPLWIKYEWHEDYEDGQFTIIKES